MGIQSRHELEYFLAADRFALGRDRSRPCFYDQVWKFQIFLRCVEFYSGQSGVLSSLLLFYFKFRKLRLAHSLGFDIPPDVFGPGLRINHFGNVVVNVNARIGAWCDIHQGVNVGVDFDGGVPVVGDNAWIGPGAKLYGPISIGSGVVIGANAVVNKSFGSAVTVAGVPAKVIRGEGTEVLDVAASKRRAVLFYSLHPEYAVFQVGG
ncbi:serine O-acetyltransferase [Uliginosibacterium sp. 31-12]|uniref:serine O-acetyltransferase n=1 Tax=Uliginosibacterium sp. 31-12 TaxID=3062781 RepID=UPI0026E2AAFC|nr:hypothetical protein [Uliginosibacterium sp. 31-12]MDO6386051.1 hypothetical protein [Uliginosibacterium sp. 31-12]